MFDPNPATGHVAVTKSDSTIYDPPFKAIWVGGIGDIVLVDSGGTSVTYTVAAVPAIIPTCTKMVKSTGTSATNIVGFVE